MLTYEFAAQKMTFHYMNIMCLREFYFRNVSQHATVELLEGCFLPILGVGCSDGIHSHLILP